MTYLQKIKPHRAAFLFLFATWGLYFTTLFSRIIRLTSAGLWFGHTNVWSDWAMHVAMANLFAFKSPALWFAYHPMYAGGKFTYPFLTNLISGLLMRLGLPLSAAFVLPSILLMAVLLVGLYLLFYQLTRSQKQAILAISLFFLSSGLGFLDFWRDFLATGDWSLWTYPLQEYSRNDAWQWYSGNVAVGMLVPQRAFLLGMTLATWACLGLVAGLHATQLHRPQKIWLLTSGILAGVLPIAHMHSFMVTVLATGTLCLVFWVAWKRWVWFALPATVLSSMFYLLFIRSGIETDQFMTWHVGWTNQQGFISWLQQWWQQWGVMIPVGVAGWVLAFPKWDRFIRVLGLVWLSLFVLGNLILFQPIAWDNSKMFLWTYLALAVGAAAALTWLWRKNLGYKVVAAVLFVSLSATGALELIRLQRIDRNRLLETPMTDIELGLAIRQSTQPTDVFLTTTAHNHFVMIWGLRPIVMGYSAWAWNFGFDFATRERDIKTMYAGGTAAETLLDQYNVSYVVIGPGELKDQAANEAYFSEHYPLAFSNDYYRVYKVN